VPTAIAYKFLHWESRHISSYARQPTNHETHSKRTISEFREWPNYCVGACV
jgi:hypothetical protein